MTVIASKLWMWRVLIWKKVLQLPYRGESGSGKSTFLNLIAGILEPDEGEIELNGVALHELTESQRDQLRAKSIGYIFQSFHLLPGYSALENLLIAMTWGGEVDESKARGLLDAVGLSERIHYLPDQLSLGQQQRVALARALVNEPQLILADEPTGNLDSLNSKASMELIKDLTAANNASLLVVSHDPQIISSFENNVIWENLMQLIACTSQHDKAWFENNFLSCGSWNK